MVFEHESPVALHGVLIAHSFMFVQLPPVAGAAKPGMHAHV